MVTRVSEMRIKEYRNYLRFKIDSVNEGRISKKQADRDIIRYKIVHGITIKKGKIILSKVM